MSTSAVKCSVGPSNRVPVTITIYTDNIQFAVHMALSFITFLYIPLVLFCITVYTVVRFVCFCLILYKNLLCFLTVTLCILIVMFMYSYCFVRSVLCILFHCVVLCTVCVLLCIVLHCTAL